MLSIFFFLSRALNVDGRLCRGGGGGGASVWRLSDIYLSPSFSSPLHGLDWTGLDSGTLGLWTLGWSSGQLPFSSLPRSDGELVGFADVVAFPSAW